MPTIFEENLLIRQYGKALADIIANPLPTHQADLAKFRLNFTRTLTQHFASVEFLLNEAKSSGIKIPDAVLTIWNEKRAIRRTHLSGNIQKWSTAGIAENWQGYGDAVIEGVIETEDLLRFEEKEIYPLISSLIDHNADGAAQATRR